jgi:hypothetical protein
VRTFKVFWFVSSMLLVGLPGYAQAHLDDPKVAHAKYEELAAKVRGGDTTVDWQALRLAAEVGYVSGNYDVQDANQRGIKAFNDGKFADSLKIANEILEHNIADGDGHFLAMISLKHLGRQPDADKENAMLVAFFQSIVKSGDGKSAKTAWFTVNVHEEYLVIRLLLGLKLKSQSLSHLDGHSYDVMTVADDSGKESTLWFNTDTDIEIFNNALKTGSGKK